MRYANGANAGSGAFWRRWLEVTAMKIYTRTGDDGTTGLFGGGRVSKSDVRLSAYGAIDELNAVLGFARSAGLPKLCDQILLVLQNQMFDLGAELATPDSAKHGAELLTDDLLDQLESWIDTLEADLAPLKTFILPGGTSAAAALHLARCVCRRAERRIVALSETASVRPLVLKYVNRLSDLLFVLARTANAEAGVGDIAWKKGQ
jgi:cob(I)alamin adenosyltransferase